MHYNEFLKRIDKDTIEPVYFFYGEERFLIEDAISRLLGKAVAPDLRGFNYHIFDGNKIELSYVLEMAQSLPVLSSWRVILIRNIHLIPAEDLSLLISYIKNPSPTTCLVLIASKLDMRKKFFHEVKELLDPIQIQTLSTVQIQSWVKSKAKDLGLTISDEAVSFIIEKRGEDLFNLLNEIEKLSVYLEDKKEVRVEDVKTVIYGKETPSIFELTGCIGERDAAASLRLLSLSLTSGEPPLVILSMIVRQFKILWRIIEARDLGRLNSALFNEIRIPRNIQGRIIKQSERFTKQELTHAFSLFLKADLQLKSSRVSPKIILESLILKLCSPL